LIPAILLAILSSYTGGTPVLVITTGTMAFNKSQNRPQGNKRNGGIRLTDSIRDEKRGIEHTVLFTWNPATDGPLPFSSDKFTGPHAGKGRLAHIAGNRWRADYVSAKTVQLAIEDGVEILSVRTERAAIVSDTFFKICPAVMNEVKGSASWQREGNDYRCIGVYQDAEGKTIKEVEFIVYPNKNRKRYVAEVRVCVLEDGLNPDMFDASVDIRENFLFWVRYGTKAKDGSTVDRRATNGFTNDIGLKFVPA
jgi:hypothetical protein